MTHERKQYTVQIQAPRKAVWDVLWADETYRKWTVPFSPGSYAVTDWKEGSKALFLGAEGSGMVARIATVRELEFMSIQHLGEVHNGVEDTTSEKVKQWAGGLENYTLTEADGITTLVVELDLPTDFVPMFDKMWPPSLHIVKTLAEERAAM